MSQSLETVSAPMTQWLGCCLHGLFLDGMGVDAPFSLRRLCPLSHTPILCEDAGIQSWALHLPGKTTSFLQSGGNKLAVVMQT